MSLWLEDPLWSSASNINSGNQFTPADGLTADDLNRIIHNLIYLKKNGGSGGGTSGDTFSNITTSYTSIIPSYDAIGPILNYTVNVPVYNDSGVIFISPANKDTSLQCSKHLQSVQVDANNNIQFTFNTLPTAEALSFRFVTIPTSEGNIVPIFDACWSESTGDIVESEGNAVELVVVDDMLDSSSHNAGEIYELIQKGFVVVAGRKSDPSFRYQFNNVSVSDGVCNFADFSYTSVSSDGIASTEFLRIYANGTAEITIYETSKSTNGITPHIGENGNWFIGDEDTGVNAEGKDGAYPVALDEMGGDEERTTYRLEFSNGTGYDFDVYHGKKGSDGKSAYKYAQEGGYTGTEAQFAKKLAETTVMVADWYSGKEVLFLGDSITQRNTTSTGWVGYFNEIVKPSRFVNVAVSGARWQDYEDTIYDGEPVVNGSDNNHNNTIGNQVEKIVRGKDSTHPNYSYVEDYENFNVIIIAAGTNDADITSSDESFEPSFVSDDGSIVSLNALDKTIFASAFRYSVETLQTLYPDADIFVCTPIQAYPTTRYYAPTKNKRDFLISLCERMSIPYIDTFMCGICGIYETKSAQGKYLIDGLHPNVAGAKKIARYNAKEFINHYVYNNTIVETTEPQYTNVLSTSTDVEGNIYNGVGYKNDARISSNAPQSEETLTGYVSTGFIPFTDGDILYSTGTAVMSNDTNSRIYAYDSAKTMLWNVKATSLYTYSLTGVIDTNTGDLQWDTQNETTGLNVTSYPTENIAFVRFCMKGSGENLIITINEEIV